MKLRLKDNSIRLRLTRGEVDRLASTGVIEERVEFAPGVRAFVYAVEASDGLKDVGAIYDNDRMAVTVPSARVRQWAESDEVGIESEVGGLRVLVEKDFACIKPRSGEDEKDMFPHPDPESC